MTVKGKVEQFFYRDPQFEMSFFERILVRFFIFLFWSLAVVLTIMLILMRESSLRFLGYFGIIFILDRIVNFDRPDKNFDKSFDQKLVTQPNCKINLLPYSEAPVKRVLVNAFEKTLSQGGNFNFQLLLEFLEERKFREIFERLEINCNELESAIRENLKKNFTRPSKKSLIKTINDLVVSAYFLRDKNYLQTRDLFVALFYIKDEELERIKNYFRIQSDDIRIAAVYSEFKKQFGRFLTPRRRRELVKQTKQEKHKIMNRAWTARPTPFLDSVSDDLTDLARAEKIGFLIGHDGEVRQLINILSRANRNNALLVGEPSSGIGAIVRHVAYLIVKDEVPSELFDKRLVALSIDELVSGCEPQAVAERVQRIVKEILDAGNVILFIPDIHNLFKTSGQNYLSAAEVLLPILSRSSFQVIGATTPGIFKTEIEPREDFMSLFEVILVNELSEEDAILFLTYSSLILEKTYKIKITYPAIKNAVKIAHRYFRDKMLPTSADDLLKEVLADVRNLKQKVLTGEDVIRVSQEKINVPLKFAEKEEAEKLLNLEKIIHERLIDQNEAVKEVSKALREYRAGLSRKGGPIATFLFVGPTGVGKTELAKILAKIQFGSENNMIRFDMSRYQDKKSIFDFVGAPEGDRPGALTEAVRQNPFSLILLDEFEKAHPDLMNIFLSVFDDGRLTDNLGRVIDFTNTIIIATSNAHSALIKERIETGVAMEQIAAELKQKLTDYFQPELINRFSDIIVFKPLSPDDLIQIARLNLADLAQSLATEQGIKLFFDDKAVKQLVKIGYDPVYGARPLRNAISDNVKAVLAEKILRGEIKRGDELMLTFEGEQFLLLPR
ncbi:MAG TPA: ATP-dependent Clp protease ATP-binding subunit [Candidatus Paceibacterota bacterium]|nr:ATP-dependent Clp protease ATP-binding subunit [Candidatus Paceibacterota bacterium]HQM34747.1 ATP-dependent Clp protease ATP-binding subunit [Candidatus Paceibacterota bacterium]